MLVDTNLLLLLVVGLYDRQRISTFTRTSTFTVDDFELLQAFLDEFLTVVTTPHVLTETSNFVGQLPKSEARKGRLLLRSLVPELEETSQPSSTLVSTSLFPQFGLTDTAIAEISPDRYLVLTGDLSLYHYLAGVGVDAINFNHLRPFNW